MKGGQLPRRRRSHRDLLSLAAPAVVIGLLVGLSTAGAGVPEYTAKIVARYPHDPSAFTEGLLFHRGFLYEVLAATDDRQSVKLTADRYRPQAEGSRSPILGEGIVIWTNRLIPADVAKRNWLCL